MKASIVRPILRWVFCIPSHRSEQAQKQKEAKKAQRKAEMEILAAEVGEANRNKKPVPPPTSGESRQ